MERRQQEPSTGIWIGIDLGTSNSTCAVWDSTRGDAKWIRLSPIAGETSNGKAGRICPSIVGMTKEATTPFSSPHIATTVGVPSLQRRNDEATLSTSSSFSSRSVLFSSVKRLLGYRTLDELDACMKDWIQTLPYDVVEQDNSFHVQDHPNGKPANDNTFQELRLQAKFDGDLRQEHLEDSTTYVVSKTPTEILSLLLEAIRESAQSYLDKHRIKKRFMVPTNVDGVDPWHILNVVVGVPAHFSQRQTQMVKQAAKWAGFNGHVATYLESTAAALAYGLTLQQKVDTTPSSSTILVIDIGGGTTDITIATPRQKPTSAAGDEPPEVVDANGTSCTLAYQVVVTKGDSHLGGDDIDQSILKFCTSDKQPLQLPASAQGLTMMRKACRDAKEQFCGERGANSFRIADPQGNSLSLTRDEFDRLLEPWLESVRALIRSAVDAFDGASEKDDTIDEVVLVGGSTRIPAVRRMIQQYFSKLQVSQSLDPMASVAKGLAVEAAALSKQIPMHQLQSALMLDCIPHAIGVALPNQGGFVEILPRNTLLPARGSATFTLADKFQAGMTIDAVEEVAFGHYEPMAEDSFSFLLRRLTSAEYEAITTRTIEIGMLVGEDGSFVVSFFDQNDPEQVRKRARANKERAQAVPMGELEFLTDALMAETSTSKEQAMLIGILVAVFILYVAVKVAFHDLDTEPTPWTEEDQL